MKTPRQESTTRQAFVERGRLTEWWLFSEEGLLTNQHLMIFGALEDIGTESGTGLKRLIEIRLIRLSLVINTRVFSLALCCLWSVGELTKWAKAVRWVCTTLRLLNGVISPRFKDSDTRVGSTTRICTFMGDLNKNSRMCRRKYSEDILWTRCCRRTRVCSRPCRIS